MGVVTLVVQYIYIAISMSIPTNFANVIFCDKDVPSCKVSVYEAFAGQVVHPE